MYAYLFKNFVHGETDTIIRKSLLMYSEEMNTDFPVPIIKKTKHGKPYFENINLHFSVSHTDSFCICVLSKQNIGIDIQKIKNAKCRKISEKYFTKQEQAHVNKFGKEGFFDIWVQKEAYIKLIGTSIGQDIRSDLNEANAVINFIDIGPRFRCAYAVEVEEEICIKIIN